MVSAVMTISSSVQSFAAASAFSREMCSTTCWGVSPSGKDSSTSGTRMSNSVMPMRPSSSCRRGDQIITESETTQVYFRSAAKEELLAYIATGEPMDKAGAYGIQGKGALLVEKLDGDFFNVMGLPVLRLSRMLAHFGIKLL